MPVPHGVHASQTAAPPQAGLVQRNLTNPNGILGVQPAAHEPVVANQPPMQPLPPAQPARSQHVGLQASGAYGHHASRGDGTFSGPERDWRSGHDVHGARPVHVLGGPPAYGASPSDYRYDDDRERDRWIRD